MKSRPLTKQEEDKAIIQILDTLLDDSIPYSGAHRRKQWEKGWKENLKSGNQVPKYFDKYPVQRLDGKLVLGISRDYERQMLYKIVDRLAEKYLSKYENVYEFGCGTGHNLWRIKKANPHALLHGFDWTESSNRIVRSLGFHAEKFDFFNPPRIKLNKNSGVYTVAALEQVGTDYRKFVRFLLNNKPSTVVHIEPIPELLDPSNLLDYLSIKYMEKRKYLSGYLKYLQSLEKQGKIRIIEARRSGIGSMFIDGYSIIVWRPVK